MCVIKSISIHKLFCQNQLNGQFATRNAQSRNTIFGGFHVSTGIFAILSLVSYFIPPDIVPGRMGMLITLYLILINSYNSVDAPPGMC